MGTTSQHVVALHYCKTYRSSSYASLAAKSTQPAVATSLVAAPARPSLRVSGQKAQTSASIRCRAEKDAASAQGAQNVSPTEPEIRPMSAEEELDNKWLNTMGFSGWAPEVINGRLAMVGILAGLGAQLATGESIPTQFS